MAIRANTFWMMSAYLLAGALLGIAIIHPLTLVILWLEFVGTDAPGFVEFMRGRVWLIFLPKQLHIAAAFAALGGVVGLGFGVLTRSYMQKLQALRFFEKEFGRTIPELIKGGESDRVEFKSSVRWDLEKSSINRGLETVIAKTIAGFTNTRGGNLIIGVADDGTVVGLGHDYKTLKDPGRDGFERMVIDVVRRKLGGDLIPLVHFSFLEIDGEDVCMLIIEAAPRAVYLDEGKNSHFYIRSGNSTRHLDVREALEFAKTRWQARA